MNLASGSRGELLHWAAGVALALHNSRDHGPQGRETLIRHWTQELIQHREDALDPWDLDEDSAPHLVEGMAGEAEDIVGRARNVRWNIFLPGWGTLVFLPRSGSLIFDAQSPSGRVIGSTANPPAWCLERWGTEPPKEDP